MVGSFVDQERSFEVPLVSVTSGLVGSDSQTITQTLPVSPYAPQQKTHSFRTTSAADPDVIDPNDLRVTRNGLTTFDPADDRGHPFWTMKKSVSEKYAEVYTQFRVPRDFNRLYFIRGNLVPFTGLSSLSPYPAWPEAMGDSDAASYGGRAIKQTSPLAPQANVAQFIGELHEGLPHMFGSTFLKDKVNFFRNAGGEYLNVQFGWKPFISDLKKAVQALSSAHKTFVQLERDNGRIVRRRFAFPAEVESTLVDVEGQIYSLPFGVPDQYLDPSYVDKPTQLLTRTERSIWFRGAFSYFVPTDKNLLAQSSMFFAKAQRLLGSEVTPATVWELAPWSWLIDWKFNIGQQLAVSSGLSENGLVLRYGYLMNHTVVTKTYQSQPQLTNSGFTLPGAFISFRSERKERVQATPFGFGLSPGSFTDSQWAILAALGMSRTRRVS